MSEKQLWKETLQSFAESYAQLVNDIEARTRAMSDDELRTLARAIDAGQPSNYNCWWATYQVSRLVREAIRMEQYRRQLGGSDDEAKPYIGEPGPEPWDDLGGGRIVRPADLLAAASDDDPEPTS